MESTVPYRIALASFFAATLSAQTPPLPRVLFFANPMTSDNDVIRRPAPGVMSVAERYFAQITKGTFEVTIVQDGAEIARDNLRNYQAVVFFTAINPPGVDREGLVAWVKDGGAFVGIHSTANTYQKFPAFGEMLGAYYDRRPWRTRENPQTRVRVLVADRNHPATRHFGESFQITDDLYQFKQLDRAGVRLLLKFDPNSLDMANPKINREDEFLPVSWVRTHGKGRVFYTALGDWEATWKDPGFQLHVIRGIQWAIDGKE